MSQLIDIKPTASTSMKQTGGRAMRTYRIDVLNVRGQTKRARYFICNSDSDALGLAQRILGTKGHAEIWLEQALVGRVQARDTRVSARFSSPATASFQYSRF